MKFVTVLLITFLVGAHICSSKPQEYKTGSSSIDLLVKRRIIGGRAAQTNQYPYQVALRKKSKSLPFCGGSIIHENWVLTAAHCVDSYRSKEGNLEIIVGIQTDLRKTSHTKQFTLKATEVIIHEDYKSLKKDDKTPFTDINDVALIRVAGSLIRNQFGIYSEKIAMAKTREDLERKAGTAIGYGQLGPTTERSTGLISVDLVINKKRCKQSTSFYEESNICAGNVTHGALKGDSGGPFVVKHDRLGGRPLLEGVASRSNVLRGYYIFARVSHFLPWIVENIRKEQ